MFEKGIQVGITQATKRYAKINNKCMTEQCNLDICLQYLDASNLDGGTTIQILPTHGLEWEKKVDDFTREKNISTGKKDGQGHDDY